MNPTQRYAPIIDWTQIKSSAPGRCILMGEYVELFDKNAIAAAINCRTTVTIKKHREGRLRLNLKNYNNIREWPTTSFTMTKLVGKYADVLEYSDPLQLRLNHLLHKRYYQQTSAPDGESSVHEQPTKEQQSVEAKQSSPSLVPTIDSDRVQQADNGTMAFLMLYVALADSYAWSSRPELDVTVETDIPIGRGLGSSTAFAVALCEALMKVFRVSAEPCVVSCWASAIDQLFHGSSSSLSALTTVYGGYVYYQSNKIKAQGVPHSSQIKIMIIDTGLRINKRDINEKLKLGDKTKYNNNPILTFIHELISVSWRKIWDAQFTPKSISTQLIANQENLKALGFHNEKIIELQARSAIYKLTVKQTQSGEAAFVLYDNVMVDECRNIRDFQKNITDAGFICRHYDISWQGLEIQIQD